MVKKSELFNDLLTFSILAVASYAAYYGVVLSNSPNCFKELLGFWFIFYALSGLDFLVFDAIHEYKLMKVAPRRNTVRPSKAGTILKHLMKLVTRIITPLAIALTAYMSFYFSALFIILLALLILTKNPYIFAMFLITITEYILVMYYGITVWRYKRAHKPIGIM